LDNIKRFFFVAQQQFWSLVKKVMYTLNQDYELGAGAYPGGRGLGVMLPLSIFVKNQY